jgi:dUTPase
VASALLEIEALSFQYRRGTEPALRDISLRIEPGEIVLVAGPSGCGKSTLIRAINGLIPHSYRGELTGRVTVDGRSTADLRLRDLATLVGTVLQDPRKQLVASTVAAELAFGPENLGVPRADIARQMAEVATAGGIDETRSTTCCPSWSTAESTPVDWLWISRGEIPEVVEKGDWPAMRRWPNLNGVPEESADLRLHQRSRWVPSGRFVCPPSPPHERPRATSAPIPSCECRTPHRRRRPDRWMTTR